MEEKLKRPDLAATPWQEMKPGLKYHDEKLGDGKVVAAGGRVKVHYTGWLTDDKATIFDSSVKRGEPIEFGLGQVIAGWRDGLVGMKVGGTRVLHLAPEVAYGSRGAGGLIGPNATLVFRVELLDTR
ncbi:MAG: FKBP-type peptidyl-prolyl cis-trans isomerase [Gemmataceae bacterium]